MNGNDMDIELLGWKHLLEKIPSKGWLSGRLADVFKQKDDIDIEITGCFSG
jgi:hypothetical protein